MSTAVPIQPLPSSPRELRRAKKRATDRKSQRNHRERQRAYVRSLEDTLSALREAGSPDQRVNALLEENRNLRDRLNGFNSQLNRIRAVVCENSTDSGGTAISTPHLETHEVSIDSQLSPGSMPNFLLDTCVHMPLEAIQTQDNDAQPADDSASSFSHLQITHALHDEPIVGCGALLQHDNASSIANALSTSLPIGLPQYCHPQGEWDKVLHAMVVEAMEAHQAGRFNASQTSLYQLLKDGPGNILSFRLFHFIQSYGAMPMHILLATFWVQYLYLRWNVLCTPESFADVPYFLRPTSLELSISHRMCISMLVWPDIRQALIRDALSVNLEEVSIELLKSLSPHWSASFAMSGDFIVSMDILQMIEIQAVRLDFWKVGPSFLDKYPQYSNCDLSDDR